MRQSSYVPTGEEINRKMKSLQNDPKMELISKDINLLTQGKNLNFD